MSVHTDGDADAISAKLEYAKEINLAVQQATAMARQIMRLEADLEFARKQRVEATSVADRSMRERDEYRRRAEAAEAKLKARGGR
jgi:hypothetical protein